MEEEKKGNFLKLLTYTCLLRLSALKGKVILNFDLIENSHILIIERNGKEKELLLLFFRDR